MNKEELEAISGSPQFISLQIHIHTVSVVKSFPNANC